MILDPASDSTLDVPANAVSCTVGRGLGGEIRGKSGRLKELGLGNYTLEDVLVNYPDPNSYVDTLKLGQTFRNGTLGGGILSRFTVIYNFSKEELYLKKNGDFKRGFYYNLSGLTIRAKGTELNTFEVTDVRKFSTADNAGVQVGDQILSVNGVRASEVNLNQLNGLLNQRPGKKINLNVKRNNAVLNTRMVLKNTL